MLYLDAAEPISREKRTVGIGRQPDSREGGIGRVLLDSGEMRLELGPELGASFITQVGRLVDRHRKTVTAGVLALRADASKCFRILRSQISSRAQFSHRRLLQDLLPHTYRPVSQCRLPRHGCVESLTEPFWMIKIP